jgi:small subunit ribosomal protein S20
VPNTVSAEKRVRQNETRRARNRTQRSALRTQVKKARQAIADKETTNLPQVLAETQVAVDKATAKGLLHRNKAARLKSRLAAAAARAKA